MWNTPGVFGDFSDKTTQFGLRSRRVAAPAALLLHAAPLVGGSAAAPLSLPTPLAPRRARVPLVVQALLAAASDAL